MTDTAKQGSARQGGFRNFKVVAKTPESRIITSFHLEPVDADGWIPFKAGQFLVLRVPPVGARRAVPRSYSVSSSPELQGRYRITIKREAAPASDIPDGVGSCWLHDRINVGDIINASGPRGEFHLDEASQRPVVLLSGGVGLTPVVSMLHQLATASTREVHFIHACDNGELHALRDEVQALARARPGIHVHFCYRFPTADDRSAQRFHSEGVLTRELLAGLLPGDAPVAGGQPKAHSSDTHEFYMCGPQPFMKAVYGILRGRGVPKERIAYEFFGPATVLEEDVAAASARAPSGPPMPAPASVPASAPDSDPASPAPAKPAARDWIALPSATPELGRAPSGVTIEFRKSGKSADWDPAAQSLLAFAEAQGLKPDFSCRAGVCSTCKTGLVAGEVVYVEEPLDPLGPGEVLICCAKPHGPVVLDL